MNKSKYRTRLSKEDLERLQKMRQENMSYSDIGKELGFSGVAIYNACQRMKLLGSVELQEAIEKDFGNDRSSTIDNIVRLIIGRIAVVIANCKNPAQLSTTLKILIDIKEELVDSKNQKKIEWLDGLFKELDDGK